MQASLEPQSATLPASFADLSLLRMIADAASPLLAYCEMAALRCRFANRSYAVHYGWDADAILGRRVREVTEQRHAMDGDAMATFWRSAAGAWGRG